MVQKKCQEKWVVAKRSMLKISEWSRIKSNLASAWLTGKGNRREAKKKSWKYLMQGQNEAN